MSTTPPHRWHQFSLRRLLLLVAILCIGPGSYVAFEQKKFGQQDGAIVLLNKIPGTEVYIRPHWLRRWTAGKSAGYVVGLALRSPRASDEDLSSMSALPELVWLNVNDTSITDSGVAQLTELRKLKRLRLDGNNVTDAGMAHLSKLTAIEMLNLSQTKITDAGLGQLASLTNLETLYLQKTDVTEAGVAELRKALPNCAIHR